MYKFNKMKFNCTELFNKTVRETIYIVKRQAVLKI